MVLGTIDMKRKDKVVEAFENQVRRVCAIYRDEPIKMQRLLYDE
jgi:hypothetical protein